MCMYIYIYTGEGAVEMCLGGPFFWGGEWVPKGGGREGERHFADLPHQ